MSRQDENTDSLLRRKRLEAGYRTAADFARGIGMKAPTYASYENGSRAITRNAAAIIGKALGVPPSILLGLDDMPATDTAPGVPNPASAARTPDPRRLDWVFADGLGVTISATRPLDAETRKRIADLLSR